MTNHRPTSGPLLAALLLTFLAPSCTRAPKIQPLPIVQQSFTRCIELRNHQTECVASADGLNWYPVAHVVVLREMPVRKVTTGGVE